MRRMSNCLKQLALLHRDREMNKTALKLYAECKMLVLLICPRRFPIDIMGYYPLLKEAGERTSLLMLLVKVLCELKRALTKGFWRFFSPSIYHAHHTAQFVRCVLPHALSQLSLTTTQ